MGLPDIIGRLFASDNASRPQAGADADTDLAALLVAAARADGDYTQVEADLIARILASYHAIDMAAAVSLRQRGEAAHHAASSDMFSFATRLKKRYSKARRLTMLEALWSVVMSDDQRHPREEALIRQTASVLGLGHRDSVHARKRVQKRMNAGNDELKEESGT